MKLLSEREQVRGVAAAWREQYPAHARDTDADKLETQQRLDALDAETATAADVEEIIGNNSWVQPKECDECTEASWHCVQLGREPGYNTATVCRKCLRAALNLTKAKE